MKKILLTLFVLTAFVYTGFSQNIQNFSMGVDMGLPTGPAATPYDYTLGFTVKFELSTHVKPFKLIVSGGYNDFVNDKHVKNSAEADFVPIAVGLKYYIHRFYVQGEAGASLNVDGNYPSSRNALFYAPTIGYCVQALDFDEVDFGIGYQARVQTGGTLGQVLLHIAYKFDL